MDPEESFSNLLLNGVVTSLVEKQNSLQPSVIVIGAGISGLAAAQNLSDASYKVTVLESRDRIGGRIHTDYSFGCPVDMGASWLHGVCNENPLAPLIHSLNLRLYRTSGDDSILYDHDLESYALFDMHGHKIPPELVTEVGETFEKILKKTEKVREENTSDMSIRQAISIVLDEHPELRQEGLAYEVLQWYICRMEAWFAVDADSISLKCWDQEELLSGGHGLMVEGYEPVIKALAKDIDIRLNHRVAKISDASTKVIVTIEDGRAFVADAVIITLPIGVLKSDLIQFEPRLPGWKASAISEIGVGNENKIALLFDRVFWPNVEFLGMVANSSYECGYFLNIHKATGNPVLVYMAAGRSANDLEKLSDKSTMEFVMSLLKKMFPDAPEPVQYLVTRWGTDRDTLGCYAFDVIGMAGDIYERLGAPVGNMFFAGEAISQEHQGSVHGAFLSGIAAAQNCRGLMSERNGTLDKLKSATFIPNKIMESTFFLQISRM